MTPFAKQRELRKEDKVGHTSTNTPLCGLKLLLSHAHSLRYGTLWELPRARLELVNSHQNVFNLLNIILPCKFENCCWWKISLLKQQGGKHQNKSSWYWYCFKYVRVWKNQPEPKTEPHTNARVEMKMKMTKWRMTDATMTWRNLNQHHSTTQPTPQPGQVTIVCADGTANGTSFWSFKLIHRCLFATPLLLTNVFDVEYETDYNKGGFQRCRKQPGVDLLGYMWMSLKPNRNRNPNHERTGRVRRWWWWWWWRWWRNQNATINQPLNQLTIRGKT